MEKKMNKFKTWLEDVPGCKLGLSHLLIWLEVPKGVFPVDGKPIL